MTPKCVPMIHVPDVRATADWYQSIGFVVSETYGDGQNGLSFAILSFGSSDVMFNSGGRPSAHHRRDVDLYVYSENVDALHERLKERVEVIEAPHDTFYGMREVIVRDPNGFWVTFGETSAGEMLMTGIADGNAGIVPVDEEILQRYAGTYTTDDGLTVRVTLKDGCLLAFPDEAHPARLFPLSQTVFKPIEVADAIVTFDVSDTGASGLMFRQGSREMHFRRVTNNDAS